MPAVLIMIGRADAAAIVRANILAASLGHRMEEDWTRKENLWSARCEVCELRVIVSPDQDRIFGAAVRRRCESA